MLRKMKNQIEAIKYYHEVKRQLRNVASEDLGLIHGQRAICRVIYTHSDLFGAPIYCCLIADKDDSDLICQCIARVSNRFGNLKPIDGLLPPAVLIW